LFRFYLDGAHTNESIELCAKWFKNQVKNDESQNFLIYKSIGDRNSEEMLKILYPLKFDKVFFTTNSPTIIAMKNKKDGRISRISEYSFLILISYRQFPSINSQHPIRTMSKTQANFKFFEWNFESTEQRSFCIWNHWASFEFHQRIEDQF
jgi:hypothetical protein